jgi:hypothetical protein
MPLLNDMPVSEAFANRQYYFEKALALNRIRDLNEQRKFVIGRNQQVYHFFKGFVSVYMVGQDRVVHEVIEVGPRRLSFFWIDPNHKP